MPLHQPRKLLVAKGGACPCHGQARTSLVLLDPTVLLAPDQLAHASVSLPAALLGQDLSCRGLGTAAGVLLHGLACAWQVGRTLGPGGFCVHLCTPLAKGAWAGSGALEELRAHSSALAATPEDLSKALELLKAAGLVTVRPGSRLAGRRTEVWASDAFGQALHAAVQLPGCGPLSWAPAASAAPPRALEVRDPRKDAGKADYSGYYRSYHRPAGAETLERLEREVQTVNAHVQRQRVEYVPAAAGPSAVTGQEQASLSWPLAGASAGRLENPIAVPPSWLAYRRVLNWIPSSGPQLHGGRFWAGWLARLSKADRRTLLLEGERTAEIDLGSCLPRLALHLEGEAGLPEDLYSGVADAAAGRALEDFPEAVGDVGQVELAKALRDAVKTAAMVYLFSSHATSASAPKAVFEALGKLRKSLGSPWPRVESERTAGGDWREFVRLSEPKELSPAEAALLRLLNLPTYRFRGERCQDFEGTLAALLEDTFGRFRELAGKSDVPLWARLQRVESAILGDVLLRATTEGMPILGIHDAVIVREHDAAKVERWMQEAYVRHVRRLPVLRRSMPKARAA